MALVVALVPGGPEDEIVRLENDLDGDGTPETSYAPVYDSTGNLVALTGAQGKPIERYLYDPYGKQTILVDSLPPVVEQVRVKDGALWLEISEEVDSAALTAAVTAGHLTLTAEAGGTPISLTATQPVQEGLQAGRRVVLTPATAPVADSSYDLVIQPDALIDSFLNRPAAAIELTFDWPAGDAVVQDTVAPRVEQILVREGHLEVQLSEEPDLTAASAALQVNGQALTWALGDDRYTLKSVPAYQPGTYSLTISTGPFDLAGLGLAEAAQKDITVSAGLLLSVVSRRPQPRQVSVSAAGNPYGFQGLPLDTETGLLYVRNRYYDPEMGRFISMDPLGYVDGPNAYGFVKNDPVNGRDPLGLQQEVQGMAELQAFNQYLLSLTPEERNAYLEEQSAQTARSGRFVVDELRAFSRRFSEMPNDLLNMPQSLWGATLSLSKMSRFLVFDCVNWPASCWQVIKADFSQLPSPLDIWEGFVNAPVEEHAEFWGAGLADATVMGAGATMEGQQVLRQLHSSRPSPRRGTGLEAATMQIDTEEWVRVGRWMGEAEYNELRVTGRVVESRSGTTHVAFPTNPAAFDRQAGAGSVYVEFEVPARSIVQTNEGWASIVGPNSLHGRLAAKRGQPVIEMPKAKNITLVTKK